MPDQKHTDRDLWEAYRVILGDDEMEKFTPEVAVNKLESMIPNLKGPESELHAFRVATLRLKIFIADNEG